MKRAGQVVVFKFPQTNLENKKPRPALLVAQLPGHYDDWLISMISSRTHQYIEGLDEHIGPDSPDFIKSGLKVESIIRVARLVVVSEDILTGTIGEISPERLTKIKDNLSLWIKTGKVNMSLPDERSADDESRMTVEKPELESISQKDDKTDAGD